MGGHQYFSYFKNSSIVLLFCCLFFDTLYAQQPIVLQPPTTTVDTTINNTPKDTTTTDTISYAAKGGGSSEASGGASGLDKNLSVGATAGSYALTPSGAASYTIPIAIPQGSAGMQPNISMVYNSQAGGGIAGRGWNIGGLSAITRTPKTMHTDGYTEGVELGNSDSYAIDGTVFSLNGGAVVPKENPAYKITPQSNSGGAPQWFNVETENGLTMEFGRAAHARFMTHNNTTPLVWYVSKIYDKYGNYMIFRYNTSDRQPRISKISYTGNAAMGQLPYNEVHFYYTPLPSNEVYETYIAGSASRSRYLLQEITSTTNGASYRTYSFNYTNNFYTLLKSITEKGKNGEKFNPTVFEYGSNSPAFTVTPSLTISDANVVGGPDFNNDGKSDIILWHKTYDNLRYDFTNWTARISNGYGGFSNYASGTIPSGSTAPEDVGVQGRTLDFNGDGTSDVLISKIDFEPNFNLIKGLEVELINGYNNTANINLFTGSPQRINLSKYLYTGDFDGDGRDEIITFTKSNPNSVYTLTLIDYDNGVVTKTVVNAMNSLPLAKDVYVIDFDGDGKQELMAIYPSGITGLNNSCEIVEFSTNGGLHTNVLYASPFPGFPSEYHTIYPGDFNGDGKTDFLTYFNAKWSMDYSKGDAFLEIPFSFNYFNSSGIEDIQIADFNGDGKSDIFYPRYSYNNQNTKIDLYFSKGSYFEQQQHIYNDIVNIVTTGDFNGDGSQEIFNLINVSNPVEILSFEPNNKKWLLHQVVDGLGRKLALTYRSLAQGTVGFYSQLSFNIPYPNRNTQPALNVVQRIRTSNGIGGNLMTNYQYQGAIINLHGRGFLGYHKKWQIYNTGAAVVTQNNFNYTYSRYVLAKKITYSNYNNGMGNPDLKETYDYDVLTHAPTNTVWTRLNKVTTKDYLRNGKTTTKSHTWNNYDRLITSTYINKAGIETINISNQWSFSNSHLGWREALLDEKTTTVQRMGQSPIVRSINYQYNNKNKLIEKKTDQGTSFEVTTSYNSFSFFGLARLITTSSNGVTSRTKILQYDAKGRFVKRTTNAIGQHAYQSYHPIYGTVSTTTGIDGLVTQFEYDGFGRPIKQTDPDGIITKTTLQFEQSPTANHSLYSQTIATTGTPFVKTFYDQLEREVELKTQGFSGNVLRTNTTYDAYGNVKTTTLPHTAAQPPIVTENNYHSTYKNRLLSTSNNIGNTLYNYNFSYGNRIVKTTYPDNTTKTTYTDYTGKMIAAADVGGMLNYEYYSSGLLKKVTMNDQWLSKMKYNLQGNQTELEERNASITKYTYNNFGELTEQTDANGNTKEMSYDVLGRIIRKTGTGTSNTQNNYYYVPSGNGINQLQSVLETNTNTKEEYTYDYLGRVERLKETVDNTVFTTKYSYNALSNLATTTYPSGANIKNTYNNLGFLKIVSHNGDMVWQGGAMNNFGQYTNIKKGDGISTYKKYDQYGFPTHFLANNPHIQDLQMEFNAQNGNLLWRSDITTNNLFEEFGYDNANRLKTTMINGQQPYDMEYLDNGNIEDDTQAGAYTYDPDKLNAVVGVTNPNNPPHISLMLQDVTYNNFNSPATIEEGTDHLELIYGPDEQRIKTVLSNNTGITATTYFLGNYELIKAANGDRTQLHYIAGGDGLAAILKIDPQGDEEMYYTYTDHLGSILTLTDKNRDIVLRQNFDAWGRERDPYFWKYSTDYAVGTQHGFEWLNRGFTGHEHLTRFQLINMNGRVYDPMVKRMLSVDNFVQDGTSTQGYNRYSYALNNPLKYTDPDGEWVHIVVGAAIGGTINLVANWDNIDNFGEGLMVFGVGAGAGALTAATGGAATGTFMASTGAALGAAAIGGAATGATNNIVGQTGNGVGLNDVDWGEVGLNGAIGGVAGIAGYGVGSWASNNLGNAIVNGLNVTSPMLSHGINGTIGGAAGGYVGGFTSGLLFSGGDLDAAFQGGWSGLKSGAIVGGGLGLGGGYLSAKSRGVSPWTGKFTERSVRGRFDIPSGWDARTSNDGRGILFQDPTNSHNSLRFSNGNPNSLNPWQQNPYLQIKYNGQTFNGLGNPLPSRRSPGSHIQIDKANSNLTFPWNK